MKLGFVQSAGPIYIFANRPNPNILWYTLGRDGDRVPCPTDCFRGFIKSIGFFEVERRGKATWKLHTQLSADAEYIIESGHDSNFSKGLLMAVSCISPDELRNSPLTISVRAGNDDKVLFCSVHLGGLWIKAQYDSETDWRAIAKTAIDNVRSANGV